MLLHILFVTFLVSRLALLGRSKPQSHKSPDGILRVVITPVSKSCPEIVL